MSSNAPIDISAIEKNCEHYANLHYKALDVLRAANGREDYKRIAKNVKLHQTKVSSLLKTAERLGLATRKDGIYKKKPGILQHMPRTTRKKNRQEPLLQVIQKWTGKKAKLSAYQHHSTFGIKLNDNPEKMAQSYLWLYRTENTIRELIRHVFAADPSWWNNRVNQQIRQDVEDAKLKYPYDGAKRRDELEYTHLGQLKEIITAKSNWALFLPFLNEQDKSSFSAIIDKAIPYRNSIAHCTPLTSEHFKVAEVRFKDILNMIK